MTEPSQASYIPWVPLHPYKKLLFVANCENKKLFNIY